MSCRYMTVLDALAKAGEAWLSFNQMRERGHCAPATKRRMMHIRRVPKAQPEALFDIQLGIWSTAGH